MAKGIILKISMDKTGYHQRSPLTPSPFLIFSDFQTCFVIEFVWEWTDRQAPLSETRGPRI